MNSRTGSKRYVRFFICLSICFPAIGLFAQQGAFEFNRIDISQGLSNNQVRSILKDSKGFLWFATMSGLNRYDGYQFKVFRHNLRDSTSLSDDNILRIFDGPDNKLWVDTHS